MDLGSWQVDKAGEGLTDAATFFYDLIRHRPVLVLSEVVQSTSYIFNSRSPLQRPNPVKELPFL